MGIARDVREVLVTEARFLCFLPVRPDLARLRAHYFIFVFLAAWVAGLGRYWDHPKAYWWQYAGLGSVAYVIVLATFLWLLFWPLRPANWTFSHVFLFVGMTSPPAILYAIPVERFTSLSVAQGINAYFLLIVAVWRVVLLILFLTRVAKMSPGLVLATAPLPLALIVTALAYFNLEHVVFQVMAGLRDDDLSPHDTSYGLVIMFTMSSIFASPFLLIAYLSAIVARFRERRKGSATEEETVESSSDTPETS